jgi:4'-phosphopantetheinyl transferase
VNDKLSLACGFDGADAAGAPGVRALATPCLAGPPEHTRGAARRLARQALAEALAQALACEPRHIQITDQRGQAPRALWHAQAPRDARRAALLAATGLSISHAPGCSLIAWHADGAVGVDLQPTDAANALPLEEMQRIAALYLGPEVCRALHADGPTVFSDRWAAHEARLKCLGVALQEWSPALQARMQACATRALRRPDTLAGSPRWSAAVAWRRRADRPASR